MSAMRSLFPMLLCLTLTACVSNAPQMTLRSSMSDDDDAAGVRIVVTVLNPAVRTAQHAGSTPKAYDAAGRYQISPAALREVAALASQYRLRRMAEWPIELLGVHCVVFEIPADSSSDQIIAALRRDRRVESVQPLQTFRTQTVSYDDAYAGLQNSLALLDIATAHRWSRGRGARIAVIDTAMDIDHPDLVGRIAGTRDFTGRPGDGETHATAVAGVIAAAANNGQGIVGIAPEAKLLALRACWQAAPAAAAQSEAICDTFTLAQAIAVAIADRADIINLSLTGPPDPLLERLLRRALSLNRIVVSAWPEELQNFPPFPASMPGVIAVGAMEAPNANPAGHFLAPGQDILTLLPQGRYDFESGSSLAAAQVSGIAALVRSRRQSITAPELRRMLEYSAGQSSLSPRIVNACAALAPIVRGASCLQEGTTH